MSYILLILTQYMLSNPSILQLSSTYKNTAVSGKSSRAVPAICIQGLFVYFQFTLTMCDRTVTRCISCIPWRSTASFIPHNGTAVSIEWFTLISGQISKKSLIICTCVTLNNSRIECNMLLCDIELSSRTIPFEIPPRQFVFNSGYSWLSLRYTGDLFRTS